MPLKQGASRGGKTDKVSPEEIQRVQTLVEKCFEGYLSKEEAIATLQINANVEPGMTNLVWSKLEMQNPDFFAAYALRVRMRHQTIQFNHLVEQVVQMQQLASRQMAQEANVAGALGQRSTELGHIGLSHTNPYSPTVAALQQHALQQSGGMGYFDLNMAYSPLQDHIDTNQFFEMSQNNPQLTSAPQTEATFTPSAAGAPSQPLGTPLGTPGHMNTVDMFSLFSPSSSAQPGDSKDQN
eukprot:TRINITY_DN3635_c0_g1_i1.p1 TRINITY_DN3635_c0_g1~~TRINITY_DN3635_c0_g1_i1.p1  ORF type:complete len:239 (-),score=36.76 TRINITY_DN3635_c0_g1_i1:703-1419(-)